MDPGRSGFYLKLVPSSHVWKSSAWHEAVTVSVRCIPEPHDFDRRASTPQLLPIKFWGLCFGAQLEILHLRAVPRRLGEFSPLEGPA
jgi:hypothetical protein